MDLPGSEDPALLAQSLETAPGGLVHPGQRLDSLERRGVGADVHQTGAGEGEVLGGCAAGMRAATIEGWTDRILCAGILTCSGQ